MTNVQHETEQESDDDCEVYCKYEKLIDLLKTKQNFI